MVPGFTAEAGLAGAGTTQRGRTRPTLDAAAIVPAQFARRLETLAGEGGGQGAEAASTCQCPCCIRHHGNLICC